MKNDLLKAVTIILLVSMIFSCKDNSKVRIFISWPGGEGLPHYQWKRGDIKPTGIEPAFIERVLEVANLDYEYIIDFQFSGEGDPRIESLTKDDADICIRSFSINDERKKHVLYSEPYYFDGLSALVRKSDSIYTLSDLNGKRVYTLEFTSAYKWAQENLSESTLLTYEKYDTAFTEPEGMLLRNEIDAYVLDKSFLEDLAGKNPSLKVLNNKFTQETIVVAVNKKRPDLVHKINKAFNKLKQTGEFHELLKGIQ